MVSGRGWLYAAIVAIAIGGPYLASQDGRRGGAGAAGRWWDSMWTVEGDTSSSPLAAIGTARNEVPRSSGSTGQSRQDAPLAADRAPIMRREVARPPEPPLPSLAEVLRFDLTPAWVSYRWPQVWSRPSDRDLATLRVTMVSGTRLTDLAGSLTYYFDRSHQLQRIDFDGTCGDPSELIAFLAQSYGFQPTTAVGGYQFVARGTGNRLISALRIDPSHHVQQSQPYERFRVSLELRRPGSTELLSARMSAKLDLPAADQKRLDDAAKRESQRISPSTKSRSQNSADSSERDLHRPLDNLLPVSG